MELIELKALMAASLLGGTFDGTRIEHLTAHEISAAVKAAQLIWEETLRQKRER